jgi:DNA helicase-2/ATP-dependent DNA helicase PcrA
MTNLNKEQRKAVTSGDGGPLLVVAPPGSGKTRTIAARAAELLCSGVESRDILLVTFTNKAAREMKERITEATGDDVKGMWCGTFHSICVRILRRLSDSYREGRSSQFVIFDKSDADSVAKSVLVEIDAPMAPSELTSWISLCKNAGLAWEDLNPDPADSELKLRQAAWRRYESKLQESDAFDFDDLLLVTWRAMKGGPVPRFDYVLVDEYQDTNKVQVELVYNWARHGNVFAVGDSRQAIYAFRGADYRNMLSFPTRFKGSEIIELKQNYRSTPPIVNWCNQIAKAHSWKEGLMSAVRDGGSKEIRRRSFMMSEDEADFIVSEIKKKVDHGESPGDIAVLYRLHSLSRPVEERLVWERIPYKVVGGLRFYDRAVVRDALAYLRFAANPKNASDLVRISKSPKRGLGSVAIQEIIKSAREHGCNLLEAMPYAIKERLSPKASKGANELYRIFIMPPTRPDSLSNYAKILIELGGLPHMWRERLNSSRNHQEEHKAEQSLEHLSAVVNAVAAYESRHENGATLDGYLSEVALLSDQDEITDDAVQLMSIHASKGLEFGTVFVMGLEDGTLPCRHAIVDGDMSEELRLFYVACSRAKDNLFVTRCNNRLVYGRYERLPPSRFLVQMEQS